MIYGLVGMYGFIQNIIIIKMPIVYYMGKYIVH
jgi:hypothetical protein